MESGVRFRQGWYVLYLLVLGWEGWDIRPFELNYLFCFFSTWKINKTILSQYHLEKSKFKVEILLRIHRNTCNAWYEVHWPKKLFRDSITWCWPFKWPVIAGFWLWTYVVVAHALLHTSGRCMVVSSHKVSQRLVWIAPPSLPPHHSSPGTRDFQLLPIMFISFKLV